ncbi:hypothetical protein ACLGI4_05630 [Streptomyces sp. HMX112]|uniref:hypothetical protein n=1 Tax=Streptomyces sp. HMX112 TaxID=3390850 RepID=UPI003A808071
MKLRWPGFLLECADGLLGFVWHGFCHIEVRVDRCTAATARPQGPDGSGQLVFQFRDAEAGRPDLIVVRVDVPAQSAREAERFLALLRHDHAVPDRPSEPADDAGLERVPLDGPEWLAAPASPVSEELFRDVMARVAGDSGDAGDTA